MSDPARYQLNRYLEDKPGGEKVYRILAASLAAVDPAKVIQDNLLRKENQLILPGKVIDLALTNQIFLLGIGKAALPMSISLGDLLGERLAEGHVLTKDRTVENPARFLPKMQLYTGGHPIPDQDGQAATGAILSRLSSLQQNDLVIVMISGGSSALLTLPAGGISLSDLKETNHLLLACGADIREINTIRKHLSLVKGGQLLKTLRPAQVVTLILSDVIGDPIDMIGSGPTAPDPSTYADALAVVDKYQLEDRLPGSVVTRLKEGRDGKHPETPKPGDPCFAGVSHLILASNLDALQAGAAQAEKEGFAVDTMPQALTGEASAAGANLAKRLMDMALRGEPLRRPACLIAGGETTVTLTSSKDTGQGGRNLEVALSALPWLDGLEKVAFITLATDGEDGPTNAAGAVVTGESFQRCQQLGLEPADYLQRHDSYTLFRSLDDLLVTGPTGTNVNDLCFLFAF